MIDIHDLQLLSRSFFQRPTVTVAQELLGKYLVCGDACGMITETEAYVGRDDPACHAARGRTKRTEVMFGEAGYSYVYFIYGMYYCLNVVTEKEGFPAAVLIRGVQTSNVAVKTDGPGKLCRAFGIDRHYNGLDMCADIKGLALAVAPDTVVYDYEATPRIGIKEGTDKLWRFVLSTS